MCCRARISDPCSHRIGLLCRKDWRTDCRQPKWQICSNTSLRCKASVPDFRRMKWIRRLQFPLTPVRLRLTEVRPLSRRTSVSTQVSESKNATGEMNSFPLDGGRLGWGWESRRAGTRPPPRPSPTKGGGRITNSPRNLRRVDTDAQGAREKREFSGRRLRPLVL